MSFFASKLFVPYITMSESSPDAPWNIFGSLLTEYSSVVHWISLVCFGVGLVLFVPIVLLIIFDLVVWAWRTASNSSPASPRDSKPTVVASNANTTAIATGIDKATLRC